MSSRIETDIVIVNKDRALAEIAALDLEAPVSGSMENFCDLFPVTESERPIFERFLGAKSVLNRSAALAALVEYGRMSGYEEDAICQPTLR